jgi:hypothetical protein
MLAEAGGVQQDRLGRLCHRGPPPQSDREGDRGKPDTPHASRSRFIGVGEEELLPVDPVVGDHLLAGGRHQPVNEGLAEVLPDVGVKGDNEQEDVRAGVTLGLPIDRQNSIKLDAGTGVYARTGSQFSNIGIAWQYRWGEGY